jgi:hypothetical protein
MMTREEVIRTAHTELWWAAHVIELHEKEITMLRTAVKLAQQQLNDQAMLIEELFFKFDYMRLQFDTKTASPEAPKDEVKKTVIDRCADHTCDDEALSGRMYCEKHRLKTGVGEV